MAGVAGGAAQAAVGKTTQVEQAYGTGSPPIQRKLGDAAIQRKADAGDGVAADAHAAADAGTAGSGGPLPFLDRIQRSFGSHDVTGVRAHTDGAAAGASVALGAQAYARGNDVAFGGAPDLHTAAHEAAHVVQQRAGVHLKGGVGEAGDAYERHADAVADTVVAGGSAEMLLSTMAGSGGGAAGAVQHKVQFQAPPGQQPAGQQPATLSDADILKQLTAGTPLTTASTQAIIDSLRTLPPVGEPAAATDGLANAINAPSSPLIGDARWRSWNLRVYGPEANWPPYLRGDTALTILAARKKIEAHAAPEEVADALRPLNPTALHQVITAWRSSLADSLFTKPMTRGTYLDLVIGASAGPSYAPPKTEAEQAPVIDPTLHTQAPDAQYDYLKRVYDARGFTFSETSADPKGNIEINVLNIRYYDMTVKGMANPKVTVNDFNGRLFVIYKDAGGKKVQSWVWSTTGPGASKQVNSRAGEQKLLQDNKLATSTAGAKIDPAVKQAVAAEKDGGKLAEAAYTDWQIATVEVSGARISADTAAALSAHRTNAAAPVTTGTESTTKTMARTAAKSALDAAQFVDTSITEAKRAKALFGKTPPAGVRDVDNILKDDAQTGKDARKELDRAGDAWALADYQEKADAEQAARQAWEKALKDKGETAGQEVSPETKAAKAAYDKARTTNNQGYGEGNPGKMSETHAIAWLQEGEYVARYNGLKGGKDHWSVNANIDNNGGTVPVYRDYNADGVIDPGEKDLPGTAVGTGVLIHVGNGVGYSIGCQVAPASTFDEFTTLIGKLGAKSSFRYALVEAPHLPPFGSNAAAPAGTGTGTPGTGATGTTGATGQ